MPGTFDVLPALKRSMGLLPASGCMMVSVANLPFPIHWHVDGLLIGVPGLTGISSAALTCVCAISWQASPDANAVQDSRVPPKSTTVNVIVRILPPQVDRTGI